MRATRDDGFLLRRSVSNHIDETADASTQVKEPEDKPVLDRSSDKPNRR